MAAALAQARAAASRGEVPVGAVVTDAAGNIVAEAGNRTRELSDPTAHAEILAIRAACAVHVSERLPGHTLHVTLEPCAMCAGAIVHARVARVVYAADDPKTGAAGSVFDTLVSPLHNHKVLVERGVLAVDSAVMLREFFRFRR